MLLKNLLSDFAAMRDQKARKKKDLFENFLNLDTSSLTVSGPLVSATHFMESERKKRHFRIDVRRLMTQDA